MVVRAVGTRASAGGLDGSRGAVHGQQMSALDGLQIGRAGVGEAFGCAVWLYAHKQEGWMYCTRLQQTE